MCSLSIARACRDRLMGVVESANPCPSFSGSFTSGQLVRRVVVEKDLLYPSLWSYFWKRITYCRSRSFSIEKAECGCRNPVSSCFGTRRIPQRSSPSNVRRLWKRGRRIPTYRFGSVTAELMRPFLGIRVCCGSINIASVRTEKD